jgi:hypothetical protein
MSRFIPATDAETLYFADGDKITNIPLIAWHCTDDGAMPVTAIGTFFPGQRYAVRCDRLLIIMPARKVTHTFRDVERELLGFVSA